MHTGGARLYARIKNLFDILAEGICSDSGSEGMCSHISFSFDPNVLGRNKRRDKWGETHIRIFYF
jgi:hypothetical protein